MTELRKLAKSCEFAQLHDSLMKDRIVCGIHSAEVKARLLREEEFFIGTIGQGDKTPAEDWNVDMAINEKNVKLKLDTGAQCNVMPLDLYKRLTSEKPRKAKTKLVSYSGHNIRTIGKNTLVVTYKQQLHPVEFHIIDQKGASSVLGLPTCLELQLVKRVYAINPEGHESTNKSSEKDERQVPSNDGQSKTKAAGYM